MGEREEACERMLDNLQDAIASLERGKEECAAESWDLFAPEDLDEVIELLRGMASKLNLKISEEDFVEVE